MTLRRVQIIVLSVALIALTADTIRLKMQNSPKGNPPEKLDFWSRLIEEGRARKAQERKEKQMATVSLIVALMALTTTGYAIYRCRRMRGNLSRLEGALLSPEQKQDLFEGVAEIQSLRVRAEQLRRSLNEELEGLKHSGNELDGKVTKIEQGVAELQLSGNQWDERITRIEKAVSGLGAMSEELEELQGFKNNVERLHDRLRQALNGDSVKAQPLPGKPQIGLSRRA